MNKFFKRAVSLTLCGVVAMGSCPIQTVFAVKSVTEADHFVKGETYSVSNMADLRTLWAKMQADSTFFITDGAIFRLEATMLKELVQLTEFLECEAFLQCFGGTLLVGDQPIQRCFPVRARIVAARAGERSPVFAKSLRPWKLMLPKATPAEGHAGFLVPILEHITKRTLEGLPQKAKSEGLPLTETLLGAEGQPADVDFVNCTDALSAAVFQSVREHHELYARRYGESTWKVEDKFDSQTKGESDGAGSKSDDTYASPSPCRCVVPNASISAPVVGGRRISATSLESCHTGDIITVNFPAEWGVLMNKIAHQPNLYPSEGVTIELQDSVMGNLEIPEEFLTRFKGILAVGSHCAENGVDVKLVHMCATCDSGSGTPKTKIRSFIPRWTLRIRPNDMVPGASPICVFGDNVSKQNIIYHAHQQEKKNKEGQNCRQSRCVGCRYWICETFPDGASWKPGSLAFTVCNALEKLHKGNLSEPIWKDLESELSNTEQPGV